MIRADWLKRAAGLGQPIRVKLGDREIEGRFDSLDAGGRLLLRRPGEGVEIISTGDVFPLAVAAATGP
jgi:BirA family biotin operon repressor/biotin-[acetyl-CoA-carboxylase] ligase